MSTPQVFINNLLSVARNPRAIITINGIQVLWQEIEITTTTFYMADTFRFVIPLLSQPAILSMNYWASAPQFMINIYIGFPPFGDLYTTADLELFFVGIADDLELDPLNGTVEMTGRDLTSLFIDTKTTQKFSNLTSSTIATNFAQQHGLTPQVTPTTGNVGVFYQDANVLMTKQLTQWDLLTFLAQQQDYVVFIQKNTLIFEPRPTSSATPYVIPITLPTLINPSPQYRGMELGLFRTMTLAQDVQVKVKVPYGSRTGKAFSAYARSTHRQRPNLPGVPAPSTMPQKYSFIIPGLTNQQAQARANSILADISSHEVKFTTYMPGDNLLLKDSLIQFKGTNSAFDQFYYPDSIVRRITVEEGYTMEISAKNHSVDSEIVP